jgi:hypothetical protein
MDGSLCQQKIPSRRNVNQHLYVNNLSSDTLYFFELVADRNGPNACTETDAYGITVGLTARGGAAASTALGPYPVHSHSM